MNQMKLQVRSEFFCGLLADFIDIAKRLFFQCSQAAFRTDLITDSSSVYETVFLFQDIENYTFN